MGALLLRVFVYVCSLASGALALPLAVALRDGDAASARAFAWPLAVGLAAAAGGVLGGHAARAVEAVGVRVGADRLLAVEERDADGVGQRGARREARMRDRR